MTTKTAMTWTMRLTETEEIVDPENVHYLAVLEGDDAVLNIDDLDGRELKGLRYGETYEVTLKRKGADGRPAAKRPIKEFAWVDHVFPYAPSEAAAETAEAEAEAFAHLAKAAADYDDAMEILREVD